MATFKKASGSIPLPPAISGGPATGKSKVIRSSNSLPSAKTPTLAPFGKNKSGNPNGNKRQAPSVSA